MLSLPAEIQVEISSYLDIKHKLSIRSVCTHLGFFQQDLDKHAFTKLLQAVMDDERETVKKILDTKPSFLLEEPVIKEGVESRKTWQRFHAEKLLKIAIKRRQLGMVELLLPYFEELEKRGVIKDGKKEALEQWDQAYAEVSKQEENLNDFFQPLITVILKETFPHGLKGELNEETKETLAAFRKKVLPDEAIWLDDYFDVEQLLIAAYTAYDNNFNVLQTWERRCLFCICVIGFIQSLITPELAKMFCESLNDVVENNQPIGDRAAALKLVNNTSFYRVSGDSPSGLGRSFMVWLGGGAGRPRTGGGGLGAVRIVGLDDLKNYVEKKQTSLASLREDLNQDSGLDMSLVENVESMELGG